MKKVRFENFEHTPVFITMDETECHSPRPFVTKKAETKMPDMSPVYTNYPKVLTYSTDPVERFECSNSSPHPVMGKTNYTKYYDPKPKCLPSNDLELSILDGSNQLKPPGEPLFCKSQQIKTVDKVFVNKMPQVCVLQSVENTVTTSPNVLRRDNNFFLRRDNIDKVLSPLQNRLKVLSFDKENNPAIKEVEVIKNKSQKLMGENNYEAVNNPINMCVCHHCNKFLQPHVSCNLQHLNPGVHNLGECVSTKATHHNHECQCLPPPIVNYCTHNNYIPPSPNIPISSTQVKEQNNTLPQNAVNKKIWCLQNIEQNKITNCTDIEQQRNIVKEKREPTVSDLFKIIKLQNEQLQLLQEKVDKFISASKYTSQNVQPHIQNYVTEHVALQTVNNEQHKISIGVMTSFEMVHTSAVVNKEIVKHTMENAQIQCNRSHISIKEVVSESDAVNLKVLDGIVPMAKTVFKGTKTHTNLSVRDTNNEIPEALVDVNEEKTLNELSLYNVHVDNPITPLMSPDQSMYLDVRDYSDSENESDDKSNVGWTYYNKVMTHVNGVLQDSDMPSSASALYRNMRQKCVQMQVDKSNVSVGKRVKFGDDPLGIQQPHIYAASTDTSLKMNQLAAKYLRHSPHVPILHQQAPKQVAATTDMSFATRNYMEKHKLLQGLPSTSTSPQVDIPKFLDITALKRQTKLL